MKNMTKTPHQTVKFETYENSFNACNITGIIFDAVPNIASTIASVFYDESEEGLFFRLMEILGHALHSYNRELKRENKTAIAQKQPNKTDISRKSFLRFPPIIIISENELVAKRVDRIIKNIFAPLFGARVQNVTRQAAETGDFHAEKAGVVLFDETLNFCDTKKHSRGEKEISATTAIFETSLFTQNKDEYPFNVVFFNTLKSRAAETVPFLKPFPTPVFSAKHFYKFSKFPDKRTLAKEVPLFGCLLREAYPVFNKPFPCYNNVSRDALHILFDNDGYREDKHHGLTTTYNNYDDNYTVED